MGTPAACRRRTCHRRRPSSAARPGGRRPRRRNRDWGSQEMARQWPAARNCGCRRSPPRRQRGQPFRPGGQPDLVAVLIDSGHRGGPPDPRTEFERSGREQRLDLTLRYVEQISEIGIQPGQVDGRALRPERETAHRQPGGANRPAAPRRSSSSMLLACRQIARESVRGAARRSSSWHGTPASASSAASARPVGPAPTTATPGLCAATARPPRHKVGHF